MLFAFAANAQERIALVIGNGAYKNVPPLANPANDAKEIGRALNDIGFKVAQGTDLNRSKMETMIREFLRDAANAKVTLFFYAGHGMQVGGRNYLIPTDADVQVSSDLEFSAIELDKIINHLSDSSRANIVIMDACRNNPLSLNLAGRSAVVGRGLAPYSTLGAGTLIAFATAPGKIAADGSGANSPFTQALVRHLRTPGLEVRQMLTRVRNDVATATDDRQIPWDNSSLRGDVYLAGRVSVVHQRQGETFKASQVIAERKIADRVAWAKASGANTVTAYRTYLADQSDGEFAPQASKRLTKLERLAADWAELKNTRDLPRLQAFADQAGASEFGPLAAVRLEELKSIESAAWNEAEQQKRLDAYQAFVLSWPNGFHLELAQQRIAELQEIRSDWDRIKNSADASRIEAFIESSGWSEYGAEATALLVALRREKQQPSSSSIRTLTADEMLKAIDGGSIKMARSNETISFATGDVPPYRKRLGKGFLKGMLNEDVAAEGVFNAKEHRSTGTRRVQGLAAIVRSRVDKTGSFFLLQMYGSERDKNNVDQRDRQFRTMQIVKDRFGYVCITTDWQSILSGAIPVKSAEKCDIKGP
jgi:uncharacterized caspase-like protein